MADPITQQRNEVFQGLARQAVAYQNQRNEVLRGLASQVNQRNEVLRSLASQVHQRNEVFRSLASQVHQRNEVLRSPNFRLPTVQHQPPNQLPAITETRGEQAFPPSRGRESQIAMLKMAVTLLMRENAELNLELCYRDRGIGPEFEIRTFGYSSN